MYYSETFFHSVSERFMLMYVTVRFCCCVVFHHLNVLQLIHFPVDGQFFQQIFIDCYVVPGIGSWNISTEKTGRSRGGYILVWFGSWCARLGGGLIINSKYNKKIFLK